MTFPLLRVALLLAIPILIWACGSSGSATTPTAADALVRLGSSAHVDFHGADGDAVDTVRQEAFHEWAVAQLGVTPTARLRYNKYRDRAHLTRVTGQVTNGFAELPTSTVHSIWPWDGHEAIHVYTALIGQPSDFFNEGIAVAMAVDPTQAQLVSLWNNTPIDTIARNLLRTGTLPAIAGLVETAAFRRLPDQTSYPVAGSFVGYLLHARTMTSMRAFFQASARGDSRGIIEGRFTSAFGWSVAEAESNWRAFLAVD